ncbi:hypothetical protein SteCoe_1147 [Stentor coeruleus]|uniref:Uncharacterized protein n=1 Tax=Stentor coeruleus TaxID=5963 RepID=A0A1R2D2C0_9CILI|nr:hypothetical protein SteCoe_1147 [Stentor coeruleus]
MEDHESEDRLVERVNKALGPAQKLVALKELSDLYKRELEMSQLKELKDTEKIKLSLLEVLRTSLEISNADPSLWHEFGEISYSLNRLPLALYAFHSASSLLPNPEYLYSYSLCLSLTHDYINALAIANYLIDAYHYEPAHKIREFVNFRINGEGKPNDLHKVKWTHIEEEVKNTVKKVSNLYNLCLAIRHLAANKDGELYVFEKGDSVTMKKKKNDKYSPPECKYWEIIEGYKIKVLEMTGCLCYGFLVQKVFVSNVQSSKVMAMFEIEIMQFIGVPLNYRKAAYEIVRFLCKNNPSPSVLLSCEVSTEIMKIYNLCMDFLRFDDEYLTLLEISLKESKYDLIIEIRNNLIQTYKSNPSLNLRCYAALAFSYFKTRGTYEKQQDSFIQQLCNADMYLDKALNLIGEDCLYLWWSDTFLNKKEFLILKKDIQIDYELLQIDKDTKTASRLASTALALLDRLTKILAHSHKADDPVYYWRKIKMILKNIGKFQFGPEEYEILSKSLYRYAAVLLYNLEDGIKLTNDHDMKGFLTMLTDNINYSMLTNETKAQLIGSCINILRHCAKYFTQIPFLFKKIFKHLDPSCLPKVFDDFHSILNAMQKHTDAKFHIQLCKAFEKACFLYNSENQKTIYSWLYGLGTKKCSCKANFPTGIPSVPNSSNKLLRILSYLHIDYNKIDEYPSSQQNLMFFTELHQKEPKFFVTCKRMENRKEKDLTENIEGHSGCCSDLTRDIAKKGFKRFGYEIIANSLKSDLKESMKYLKTAAEVLTQAICLDPLDYESWKLMGLAYFWKWLLGYFDLLHTMDTVQAGIEHYDLALKYMRKAAGSIDLDIARFCNEHISILLYLMVEADKKYLKSALEQMPSGQSEIICTIRLILRLKNKDQCLGFENEGSHAIYDIIKYNNTSDPETLEELKKSEDVFAGYYAIKFSGMWQEVIDGNFLMCKLSEEDIITSRQGILWKLRRKAGERCLDILKMENNQDKILTLISKYSSLCGRGRKNKEVIRVVIKALHILSLVDPEKAKSELEKTGLLNNKEKQNLKDELKLDKLDQIDKPDQIEKPNQKDIHMQIDISEQIDKPNN